MTRKDIIIISLLVNAGILTLLFMLAVNQREAVVDSQEGMAMAIETVADIADKSRPSAFGSQEQPKSLSAFSDEEMDLSPELDEEGYVQLEKQPPRPIPVEQQEESDERQDNLDFVEIKVKKGDALEKIARHNGTSVEAIKEANHLTSAKLSIGQTLRIPVTSKASASSTETVAAAVPKNNEPLYHTVKSGDSPWKIAKQYQINLDELLRLNDMDEARARNLKVGEKIRVR